MSDLISKIATGESPVDVTDEIKQILMQKALERIETVRPAVVSNMFDLEDNVEEDWVKTMKSYRQFISESINIAGDFNGNLYVNGSENQSKPVGESFVADVIWEGKLYRLEVEGKMMSKNELAENLQGDYPGAIVHNIYPQTTSSLKIKSSQRYQPERLTWTD